jgi:uncharacterized membrane protein
MEEWLVTITKGAVHCVEIMALIVLFFGTVQAFINGLKAMLSPSATNHQRREVWMRYSQWLIYGLTFQLAADIIETEIAPSWNEIGQLGVIAVIRTFLNYFLERDMAETRERDVSAKERSQEASGEQIAGMRSNENIQGQTHKTIKEN